MPTQHFLPAKTDKHHFRFLVATDCKYRESIYNCKILSFILFFQKDPFDEPFYKNKKSQTTPRKPSPRIMYCQLLDNFYRNGHGQSFSLARNSFQPGCAAFAGQREKNLRNKTSRLKLKVDGYYDL